MISIKKTAVPARGTTVYDFNHQEIAWACKMERHLRIFRCRFCVPIARTTQTNRHTGRFSDLHPTSGSLPIRFYGQWVNIPRICDRIPVLLDIGSHRTLTAARPSRNFTAFPFDYLKAKNFQACSQLSTFHKRTKLVMGLLP